MRFESMMPELGRKAPEFALPDPSGRIYTLNDFADAKALLVTFICNHCPFVHHIIDNFVAFVTEYKAKGLATVAISSNDVAAFPDDSPEEMAKFARTRGFTFPYLYDESQQAAKDYEAACTPDFFLYDSDRRLYYRGQYDGSRPTIPQAAGNVLPVTGEDMRRAVDAVLAGNPAPDPQISSRGCSLKWKPGNAPTWG